MGLVVVVGLVGAAALAAMMVSLTRRNRVVRTLRTRAPLVWLWSARAPARYHRSLRRALRGAQGALSQAASSGLDVDGLKDCLGELIGQAGILDDRLVVISRFSPRIRRTMLRGVRPDVRGLEDLAARLAATVATRAVVSDDHLARRRTEMTERLDALDAAHAEVAGLETAWRARPAPDHPQPGVKRVE